MDNLSHDRRYHRIVSVAGVYIGYRGGTRLAQRATARRHAARGKLLLTVSADGLTLAPTGGDAVHVLFVAQGFRGRGADLPATSARRLTVNSSTVALKEAFKQPKDSLVKLSTFYWNKIKAVWTPTPSVAQLGKNLARKLPSSISILLVFHGPQSHMASFTSSS